MRFCRTILLTVAAIALFRIASQALYAEDKIDQSRQGAIKGRVFDHDTRQPLAGVSVVIPGKNKQTVTDGKGFFSFSGLDVGTYTLQISLPDVAPLSKTDVIVKSSKVTFVEFDYDIKATLSESVTVSSGYFNPVQEQPTGRTSFSAEEIRRSAGGIGDISRMITSLPSVSKVGDDANSLVVRGGNPAENKFFVDNIEIPNINHFPIPGSTGGHIGLLNIDFIQDVNFYCGGFSAAYGDALSSILDITYRQGSRDKISGQANLDMAGVGGTIEGPLGRDKGSWMLSAHRSYLDWILNAVGGHGIAPLYSDVQGKLVWEFSPQSRLTFLSIFGFDRIDFTKDDAATEGQNEYGGGNYNEGTLGLNWFLSWSDKGYSNTSLSYSFNKTRFKFYRWTDDVLHFSSKADESSLILRNVNHFRFSPSVKIRFGFEAKRLYDDYDTFLKGYINELGIPIPDSDSSFAPNVTKGGLFAEANVLLFDRLGLNLSLRGDYFSYNGHTLLSPRFSASYAISDKTSLTGAAGVFRQSLPALLLGEFNIHRHDLKDPYSRHLTLGITQVLNSSTRLSLEIYDKMYKNLPLDPNQPGLFLFDAVREGGFRGYCPLLDTGEAYSRGLELSIQKKLKEKLYGMASVSLFRTRYRDQFGIWRDRIFNNRLMVTVDGGYKLDRNWEFSARWMYAGGNPYTPYDLASSVAAGEGRLDTSRINADLRADYHALNVRLDRRFYFGRSNLTVYFMLWNAYDRKNVSEPYWNVVKQRPDWEKQWSLLPVGGIQFEF